MAHEVETMMYAGETPWHSLGVKVEKIATAEEAIAAAGLDWEVEKVPVFMEQGFGIATGYEQIKNRNALRRTTDGRVFDIVYDQYEPVQNRDAFKFFDSVAGTGKAKYHTAGALREGSIIWMLARLANGGENGSIGIKGDEVAKFLLLVNGHNGHTALQMFWTPVRVVCMNTLSVALSKDATRFYHRHTRSIHDSMGRAQEILGLADVWFTQWKAQAERLATLALPPHEMPLLLNAAFGYEHGVPMEEVYAPTKRAMEMVEVLMETGKGLNDPKIRGTKYAAFNAVAEYTDYLKAPRSQAEDARLHSVWFGPGAEIKRRAWSYLLQSSK